MVGSLKPLRQEPVCSHFWGQANALQLFKVKEIQGLVRQSDLTAAIEQNADTQNFICS